VWFVLCALWRYRAELVWCDYVVVKFMSRPSDVGYIYKEVSSRE